MEVFGKKYSPEEWSAGCRASTSLSDYLGRPNWLTAVGVTVFESKVVLVVYVCEDFPIEEVQTIEEWEGFYVRWEPMGTVRPCV